MSTHMRHSTFSVGISRGRLFATACLALQLPFSAMAQTESSLASRSDEPLRTEFSAARAAAGLDAIPRDWKDTTCVTCHLQHSYLMARPAISANTPAYEKMLRALEQATTKPLGPTPSKQEITAVVLTAVALARHDARTSGILRPVTRQALDRMWDLQREDGTWDWAVSQSHFSAIDLHFGLTWAAIAGGMAPEQYAETRKAVTGLERIRRYLERHPPTSLHQRTLLLLASKHVAGMLTREQRQQTIADLCAAQAPDGGWNSVSLLAPGDRPADGPALTSSDGYATGFVLYVLREAGGLTAGDSRARQAVTWLKTHQRASGRWFTRSLSGKQRNVISLEGTAWAVLALGACGELAESQHGTPKN
jgi:squalene-hopene/tetraprenyl-beta-curcumene cyclase